MVPIEVSVRNFSSKEGAKALCVYGGVRRRKYCPGKAHFRSIHSNPTACVIVARWFEYLWPSLRDRFRFDILSGKLSVDARYHFDTRLSPSICR